MDEVREILDATRRAAEDGLGIVAQTRAEHGFVDHDDDDGPRMRAWKQRALLPAEPLPSPLNASLIGMIRYCIVESERAGRAITAGCALKRLQEHYEAYDARELPPDEQSWEAVTAKYVPVPAERIAELLSLVTRSGRTLRCASCGADLHSRCACGVSYVSDRALPVPVAEPTAHDRAMAALTADPTKSNRAIAAEIGVGHQTVGRARKQLQIAFGGGPHDGPPPAKEPPP